MILLLENPSAAIPYRFDIEASCILEEIISVQKPCQLVSFRMPYQVAVLRQFDTFGNTGFHDIDIRISDETEIE